MMPVMRKDLTKKQILETSAFYNTYAKDYAEKIEWSLTTLAEIKKLNIDPFAKFLKKNASILLAGCGTGRDYRIFSQLGYQCLGIDISQGMLNEAKKRVRKGIFLKLDLRDILKLKKKFDGLYCESALTHIPKNELRKVLGTFREVLNKDGVVYLAIKVGQSGVLEKENFGAKRYFIVYNKNIFDKILKQAHFKIIWSCLSKHSLPDFPKWYSIILKKES